MLAGQNYLPYEKKLNALKVALPSLACDCHFHVFEDPKLFPYGAIRSYTPTQAPLNAYTKLMHTCGIERAVYIQPSIYGADHSLMEALLIDNSQWLRAVAVAFPNTTDLTLSKWHELGVRGTRCNALFDGGISTNQIQEISERVRQFGWHIQLCVDISKNADLIPELNQRGITVVVDHFGHFPLNTAKRCKGFATLLEMLKEGNTWVKLSGPYRVSAQRVKFSECRWAAEQLLKANADRVIWGSDWPHPAITSAMVNDGDLINAIPEWIGTENMQKVMVTNPSNLYWAT